MTLPISARWLEVSDLGRAIGGQLRPAACQFTATLDRLLTALGDGPHLMSGDADTSMLTRTGRALGSEDLVMHERERC